MVETKKLILELQIKIDIAIDILQDSHRIKAVKEELSRSILRDCMIREWHLRLRTSIQR